MNKTRKFSKTISVILIFVLLLLSSVSVFAMEDAHECTHGHEDTVEGLLACFGHHINMGHISDPEVAQGLIDKLIATQDALNRGKTATAINILSGLINQIEAQSGKTIPANHAEHMIDHIERVIVALGG